MTVRSLNHVGPPLPNPATTTQADTLATSLARCSPSDQGALDDRSVRGIGPRTGAPDLRANGRHLAWLPDAFLLHTMPGRTVRTGGLQRTVVYMPVCHAWRGCLVGSCMGWSGHGGGGISAALRALHRAYDRGSCVPSGDAVGPRAWGPRREWSAAGRSLHMDPAPCEPLTPRGRGCLRDHLLLFWFCFVSVERRTVLAPRVFPNPPFSGARAWVSTPEWSTPHEHDSAS